MGFSSELFINLISKKDHFFNKKIAILGMPCPENSFLMHRYLRKNLSQKFLKYLYQVKRNNFVRVLFEEFLQVSELDIFDIDINEGANIALNLTSKDSIKKEYMGIYDFIFDLDVHEHVSSQDIFLENIFKMLSDNGYFIWENPSNNWLDHSPRQLSPTYFNDLVYANTSFLRLDSLSIRVKNTTTMADLTDCYDAPLTKKELRFWRANHLLNNSSKDLKIFNVSNVIIDIFNTITENIYVQGSIKKIKTSQKLEFDFVQYIYRKPKKKRQRLSKKSPIVFKDKPKLSLMQKIKNLFISRKFPLPASLKLSIVHIIIFFFKKLNF